MSELTLLHIYIYIYMNKDSYLNMFYVYIYIYIYMYVRTLFDSLSLYIPKALRTHVLRYLGPMTIL